MVKLKCGIKKRPKQGLVWKANLSSFFGFKLLVNVTKEELLKTARASLIKNQAEIIVANDLTKISNQEHRAYLIGKDTVIQAQSKEEIAQLLYLHIHNT